MGLGNLQFISQEGSDILIDLIVAEELGQVLDELLVVLECVSRQLVLLEFRILVPSIDSRQATFPTLGSNLEPFDLVLMELDVVLKQVLVGEVLKAVYEVKTVGIPHAPIEYPGPLIGTQSCTDSPLRTLGLDWLPYRRVVLRLHWRLTETALVDLVDFRLRCVVQHLEWSFLQVWSHDLLILDHRVDGLGFLDVLNVVHCFLRQLLPLSLLLSNEGYLLLTSLGIEQVKPNVLFLASLKLLHHFVEVRKTALMILGSRIGLRDRTASSFDSIWCIRSDDVGQDATLLQTSLLIRYLVLPKVL